MHTSGDVTLSSFEKKEKSLAQWLTWMEETRPEHDIDFGLDRIRLVGDRLDLLKPAPFIITVGGTNGKGSTLAVLEAVLLAAGYRVGLFTSPHFLKFNERIRINGEQVSDDWLCDAFETINESRKTTWLTYFEFATLAAVDCFKRAEVDVALMEVGLGGRLDATNAIDPDVSVITTVALDHQEYLGFSIEAIAKEKSGIFRASKPAIFGDQPVPQAITDMAERLGSPLYCRGEAFTLARSGNTWHWSGSENQQLNNLPVPNVVIDNAATALQALQFLPKPIAIEAVREGLSQVSVTGRFQKLMMENESGESIDVVLDVAHNPQAAEMLKQRLDESPAEGKTRAVIAMCKDKDYMAVVDCLSGDIDEWYVAQFESPRALAEQELAKRLVDRGYSVNRYQQVAEALHHALERSTSGDRVLVTGSFMTVSAALTNSH
ncbi:bifunctional tetrahydrofolate synthase/dihydrofolate synthase [Endozoicomonas sp. ALE010]|uniref:bifunctional tetrahydrofolate synthase/dihydrofolate synthase n=1 Tax=Endozoicomonas sp. ALE010 TaxID=3403081 RepID=UPI003BB7B904